MGIVEVRFKSRIRSCFLANLVTICCTYIYNNILFFICFLLFFFIFLLLWKMLNFAWCKSPRYNCIFLFLYHNLEDKHKVPEFSSKFIFLSLRHKWKLQTKVKYIMPRFIISLKQGIERNILISCTNITEQSSISRQIEI